jgi:hypothetical protein
VFTNTIVGKKNQKIREREKCGRERNWRRRGGGEKKVIKK